MTKKRGPGRPPGSGLKENARTVSKSIRWTPDEWGVIEQRAKAAGMKASDWQRWKLLQE